MKLLVSVGFFEVSNLSYVGRSNAMRQVYYGVTWIHGHTFLRVGIPKSLAQVWICSKKRRYNVELPRLTKSKYGKTEVIQGSSD